MRAIDLAGKNSAHAAGFYDGRHGNPAVSDDPEYMAGFDLGRHVQAGYENPGKGEPTWFRALPWWTYAALLVVVVMVTILAMRT